MKKFVRFSASFVIVLGVSACADPAPLNHGSGEAAGNSNASSASSKGGSSATLSSGKLGMGGSGRNESSHAGSSPSNTNGEGGRSGEVSNPEPQGRASTLGGSSSESQTSMGGSGNVGETSSTPTVGGAFSTGGTPSTLAGGGAPNVGGQSAALTCPTGRGPTMVKLPEGYCIDSTEVTQAQYADWLATATNDALKAQDQTTCDWNDSFVPSDGCLNGDRFHACVPAVGFSDCSNHPQGCVDWCDAVAYCKAQNKRLCGRISGGSYPPAEHTDATQSQWYNACSNGGTTAYPYGNSYDATACNYPEANNTVPVRSFPACQGTGTYSKIYDMSGNVLEWIDSCESDDKQARCIAAGGHAWSWYMSSASQYPSWARCSAPSDGNQMPRSTVFASLGFRCCYP